MALGIAAAVLAASLAQASPTDCAVDTAAMLKLDPAQFDQDMGGWRPLAGREDCANAAADLLAAYREAHWGALTAHQLHISYWHEGQVRASAGQSDRAIPLLMAGVDPSGEPSFYEYALGTIAFLHGDLADLKAERDRLAAVPRPSWFAKAAADMKARYGTDLKWPLNLDVLDGLIACFGQPYNKAYGCRVAGS